MFGSSKKARSSRIDTVIGHQTVIDGNIRFTGGLHVDGTIRGSVTAESDSDAMLTVSEQGCIEGEVRVPGLELNGAVVGDVYVSGQLELAGQARVAGNVFYNLLEMAMGAEVNGRLVHQTDAQLSSVEMPESLPGESQIKAIS